MFNYRLQLKLSNLDLPWLVSGHDCEEEVEHKGDVREHKRHSDSVTEIGKVVTNGHPTSVAIPIPTHITSCSCCRTSGHQQCHHNQIMQKHVEVVGWVQEFTANDQSKEQRYHRKGKCNEIFICEKLESRWVAVSCINLDAKHNGRLVAGEHNPCSG